LPNFKLQITTLSFNQVSHVVDQDRIRKFREDRKLLPYNDILIARRMKVDRSNYSKAVNSGPITNGFLQKFYGAFGDELKERQGVDKPVDITETIDELERRLDRRIKKFEENMASLMHANFSKIEAMVSQLVQRAAKSGDSGKE